ncbi:MULTISPECIES: nitrate/nitrite transporter [Bosea]|uniref:MFS transporter n=1 Tax=Bosea TaxID=85413 RepID=UPI00214F9165|nr:MULTISPECIES: MFS transporter [Bosea]MCR4522863.1 MFS transporter [Bosea sp. 47.2.35]MDR6828220.1 MFS family permease [Bosea robiniae]MDR6897808.1 MFS family permease [Bosea sp. BE109]MDR7141219.1 MFS family permease [Bosea sp. BE168]MDR7177881.1 MFS family permease [Bosea sp. BE271]
MIVFIALLPAYVLSIFYRSFLSVIAGPVMADLNIGPAAFGLLGAAWFLAFALAQFPVGWALDRLGPRRTVAFAMAIGTVGAFLFTQAGSAAMAAFAMALIGIGCSPVFMSSLFLFARNAAPERFGLLTSLFIALGSLGNIAGAAPLAIAAGHFGWRGAMMAMAIGFLVATVLAVALVRDPPPRPASAKPDEGLLQGLASILALKPLWLIAPLTITGYAIVATARGLWIGPFMTQVHGFDPVSAGHAASIMAAAMIAGAFIYGWLESRTGRAKAIVTWGTLLTALGFVALALSGQQSHVTAVALFSLVGAAGFTYAILMAHARQFFPEHLIGRGMTFVNFLFIAGAGALQSVSGWFIAEQRAAGLDAATTFANLHWAFAALLLASVGVYALSPARPKH